MRYNANEEYHITPYKKLIANQLLDCLGLAWIFNCKMLSHNDYQTIWWQCSEFSKYWKGMPYI